MDNLAHTLAGAALGEAGLKEKTGLGMVTLMLAANLPDIDILALAFDENLAFRRGITHGPVALLVLPPLLAGLMIVFDRWQVRRGTRPLGRLPVHPGWLVALAYIGMLSHPLMDFLNTYGIRCLMPFSERWFYGDTLFIIDVWMWSLLAVGVWLSRRRRRRGDGAVRRPALAAIVGVIVYTGAMGASGLAAEAITARAVEAQGLGTPIEVVASPVPINPFRREMVYDLGAAYGFGELVWRPAPDLTLAPELLAKNMRDPAVAAAAGQSDEITDFLYWSRLPFAEVTRGPNGAQVRISDARYSSSITSGNFTVEAFVPAEAQ